MNFVKTVVIVVVVVAIAATAEKKYRVGQKK